MRMAPLALLLLAACHAHAQQAVLRIACEDDATGAAITVNGVFKGDCPLDMRVKPGTVNIVAVKKVDATHEQRFESEFRIGEDVAKRIEVQLSAPQLTAEAARVEAEHQRRAEEQRRADEAEAATRKAAEAQRQADLRRAAVARAAEANRLKRRALHDGLAAFKASPAYASMAAATRDDIERILSLPVDNYRELQVDSIDAVRALVGQDDFFQVGEGTGSHQANDESGGVSRLNKCENEGRRTNLISTMSSKGLFGGKVVMRSILDTALAGLIPLNEQVTYVQGNHSTAYVTDSITSVHGQAFPLRVGARFGASYSRYSMYEGQKARVSEKLISCTVVVDAPGKTTLACLTNAKDNPAFHHFERFSWSETAACFARLSDQLVDW